MISIIIATRDRASYLLRALDSLERQIDAPPFEVIVVDNGSTDETPQIARAAADRFALTYLHEAEPNRGAARNREQARDCEPRRRRADCVHRRRRLVAAAFSGSPRRRARSGGFARRLRADHQRAIVRRDAQADAG